MSQKTPDPTGAAIRRLREGSETTQERLAINAEVTIGTLSRIERGEVADPKVGTLRKIAKALDMSLAELIDVAKDEGTP